MSDTSQGTGWWLASDGKWYPPETWTGTSPQPGFAQPAGYAQYPTGPTTGGWVWTGGPAPATRHTNGLAIASLACACAGPFLFGIGSVLGIIFGFVARSQIRKSNGNQEGGGLALAGIIVGFSVVALFIIVVILIAIFANTSTCSSTFSSYNCSVN